VHDGEDLQDLAVAHIQRSRRSCHDSQPAGNRDRETAG
jgi:hypothetical protein